MTICTIRLYELTDAEEMAAAVVESAAEIGRWMSWAHPGYSPSEAREWVKAQRELVTQGLAY
jgi:hypothetical protein